MNLIECAVDIIERDGWCQNTLHDDEGRSCIAGALAKAAVTLGGEQVFDAEYPWETREFFRARAAMLSELGAGRCSAAAIPIWNDTLGRSEAEVLEFMRMSAKRLANGDFSAADAVPVRVVL